MRSIVPVISLAVLLAAVLLEFLFPQYSNLVFFALLVWVIASFVYFLRPSAVRGARPTLSATAPLSSPNLAGLSPDLGFCIYCATPIEPGTVTCPSCGRSLPLA